MQTIYEFQQDGVRLSVRVSTFTDFTDYLFIYSLAVHYTILSRRSFLGSLSDNFYNI